MKEEKPITCSYQETYVIFTTVTLSSICSCLVSPKRNSSFSWRSCFGHSYSKRMLQRSRNSTPPVVTLTLRWMGQIILLKEEDITLLLWMVKQVIDRLQNWSHYFSCYCLFSLQPYLLFSCIHLSSEGKHQAGRGRIHSCKTEPVLQAM